MRSLKFHTSPKKFSPPTERRHSHSPFLSTTQSFANGNQNNNNIPSWPRPSRWESQSSKAISLRPKSLRYTRLRLVRGTQPWRGAATCADLIPVLNPCLKMQWISSNWGEASAETVKNRFIEQVSIFTRCNTIIGRSSYPLDAQFQNGERCSCRHCKPSIDRVQGCPRALHLGHLKRPQPSVRHFCHV